jgi:hypothetical protein
MALLRSGSSRNEKVVPRPGMELSFGDAPCNGTNSRAGVSDNSAGFCRWRALLAAASSLPNSTSVVTSGAADFVDLGVLGQSAALGGRARILARA